MKIEISDVIARLRLLIKQQDLEIADFAAEVGEKPQRIKNILGAHQRIPGEVLCKVVEVFGVDGNWLLIGEGPMYRRPNALMEPLTRQEKALLDNYRACGSRKQQALDLMADVLAGGG